MEKNSKIFVAGHRGLVGSAIVRALQTEGFSNITVRTHAELDLLDQRAVREFFAAEKPEFVFAAAAKVGGIMANKTHPADFIRENLIIETNIITSAYEAGAKKLLFLGSSCIYPREAPQPIKEESLLTGPLEETNRAYAIAKIAGIELCQSYARQYGANYISLMPTNLYGPGDNFDLENSHVLPALIRKFDDARRKSAPDVQVWGTGSAQREFLHVDDLGRACVFLMQSYNSPEIVNVGTGTDISIQELAQMIQKIVGFEGVIQWDATRPDGTPRKLLNVEKIHALGWKHSIELEEGIRSTYAWYQTHYGA